MLLIFFKNRIYYFFAKNFELTFKKMSRFTLGGKSYLLDDLLGNKSQLSAIKRKQIKEGVRCQYSIIVDDERKIVEIHGVLITQAELEDKVPEFPIMEVWLFLSFSICIAYVPHRKFFCA